MSWERILKRELNFENLADEVMEFQLNEANVVRWDDWRDFYNRIGDDPIFPDSDNAGELRGKLKESQKKYIDSRISDVLQAVEDYNDALFSLSEALYELTTEEEEEEEDPVPQLKYGNKNQETLQALEDFQSQYYENEFTDYRTNREMSAFMAAVSRGDTDNLERDYPEAYLIFNEAGLLNDLE